MVGLQAFLIALLAWDVTFGHGGRSQGVSKQMTDTELPKRSHRVVPLESELAQLEHTYGNENERTLEGLTSEKNLPDISGNLGIKTQSEVLSSKTNNDNQEEINDNLDKNKSGNEIFLPEGKMANLDEDKPEITPEFMDNYRKDLLTVMKKWNADIPLQNYESVRWQKRKLTSLDSHLSDNGNIEIEVPKPKRKKSRHQRKGWGKGRVSRLLPLPNENSNYDGYSNNHVDGEELANSNSTLNDTSSAIKIKTRKIKKVRVPLPYTNTSPNEIHSNKTTNEIVTKLQEETSKKRKNKNNKNKQNRRGKKRRKSVPPLS